MEAQREAHSRRVAEVAATVKRFHAQQKPFRLYHGSTNSTRASTRTAANTVNTSSLHHILSIDAGARTALVEPNVPLDQLVQETVGKHGLVPPVVMEFPGITVGGGFAGTSGESSSFRYGAFDTTMNSVELVLPNGDVVTASRSTTAKGEAVAASSEGEGRDLVDLFWGSASAFGTLGVVTLLEIRLRPAQPYVALTYSLVTSAEESVVKIRQECDDQENDYVDGIVFGKDCTVVCAGRMVAEVAKGSAGPRTFSRRGDPWFYLRAEQAAKELQARSSSKPEKGASDSITDYIPLMDYLFRYDRGGFWAARYAFRYFLTPFNGVTRRLLDRFMHTREIYRAAHQSGLADSYMVQDVGVPFSAVPEFQAWLDRTFGIYPLWLCPLRIRRDDADSGHGIHARFAQPDTPDLMNFGIWGPLTGRPRSRVDRADVVRLNRLLEDKVRELGGKKWLYAQAFYTEEEFWANYDKESYEALRRKYGAEYMPSVYDKVKTDSAGQEGGSRKTKERILDVWPVRGLYGVWKTAVGGDYLLKK